MFFEALAIKNADKPLTKKILKDPNSPEVKFLLYVYSIEPPIYEHLNNACRTMDETKLRTLGPYSCAMYMLLLSGKDSE